MKHVQNRENETSKEEIREDRAYSLLGKVLDTISNIVTLTSMLICGIIGYFIAGIPGLIIGIIIGLCI